MWEVERFAIMPRGAARFKVGAPVRRFDRKRQVYMTCRIALKRGVSRIELKSESCSIHSLCPNPRSMERSRPENASRTRWSECGEWLLQGEVVLPVETLSQRFAFRDFKYQQLQYACIEEFLLYSGQGKRSLRGSNIHGPIGV